MKNSNPPTTPTPERKLLLPAVTFDAVKLVQQYERMNNREQHESRRLIIRYQAARARDLLTYSEIQNRLDKIARELSNPEPNLTLIRSLAGAP